MDDVTNIEEETPIIDANCKEVLPLIAKRSRGNNKPSRKVEVTIEQMYDNHCRVAVTHVGHSSFEFAVDKGLRVRKSLVDEVKHIIVPSSLWRRILHLFRHPRIAENPGRRRMYDTS